MVRWIKEFAKRLPYPVFLRLFYLRFRLREVPAHRRMAATAGLKSLAELDLAGKKASDTLVILGSGASINQIPPRRWHALLRHDTVGFNFWICHPVVPKMYFVEAIPPMDSPMHEAYCRLAGARVAEYRNVLKVVTAPEYPFAHPEAWDGDLYTVETVPVAARTCDEFRRGLRYLNASNLFAPAYRVQRLFKQASTLSCLISLGVVLRYKNIVLCGVDLTHSKYFYQDKSLYPQACHLEFMPAQMAHPTNSQMPWHLPVASVVRIMLEELIRPRGIELYVENTSSALYPGIPVAPESLLA